MLFTEKPLSGEEWVRICVITRTLPIPERLDDDGILMVRAVLGLLRRLNCPDIFVVIEEKEEGVLPPENARQFLEAVRTYPGHKIGLTIGLTKTLGINLLNVCQERLGTNKASFLVEFPALGKLSANEAVEAGLVDRLIPDAELDQFFMDRKMAYYS